MSEAISQFYKAKSISVLQFFSIKNGLLDFLEAFTAALFFRTDRSFINWLNKYVQNINNKNTFSICN